MEFYKYLAVWTFYTITYGSNASRIQCGSSNFCFCTTNLYDIEFQCPNENDWKLNIKVGTVHNEVSIQCRGKINWHDEILPLLWKEDVEYFDFHMCPLPTNFTEITNKLQINNIRRIQFYNSTDFANFTLTRDYFSDLPTLERLTLNFVNIKIITDDAFQSLDNLIELNLEDNKIELTDDIFTQLPKLKSLTLGNNALSSLPSNVFKNLAELSYLGLSYNRFITINSTTFNHLKNLRILQLRDMQLEHLPENLLYYLKNLTHIDLSINKLQSIPKNFFKHNKFLEVVMMLRNPNITYLPSNLFSNLTKLKKIMLNECKLNNLPNELFDGSINLERIDLQWNEIEYIPTNIFKGLERLQELDLSYNQISGFPNEAFWSLIELNILNLQNNLLTIIKKEHFSHLPNLEELNLKNNKISVIDPPSFNRLLKLKKLILANNCFDVPRNVTLFLNNVDLYEVDLSGNNITVMGNFTTFTKLMKLDISYNQISSLNFTDIFTVASPININLEHNNIRTVYLTEAEMLSIGQENRIVLLNGNPLACNCHLYNFVRYLNRGINVPINIIADICLSPHDLLNISLSNLEPEILTCSLQELEIEDKLIDTCTYRFRPWDKSLIVLCTNASLTEPPKLLLPQEKFFNTIEMHLERNLLTSGPKENMGYEHVSKLFLSSNYINKITWIPPKLKVLELNNNNITYLNYKILNSSLLTNITLGKNPWNCDCSMVDLISFLVSKLSRKQLGIDANITTTTCKDGPKLLLSLRSDTICPNNKALILGLGITISLTALLIVLLMAFYYRYREEVKVWLFAHNMILWFVTDNETDRDKIYDAFISYSHEDEAFVLNELLPVLEQSPQPYKFCLHIRNSVAGELIFKQITTSVTESRRTIVILSRNFLNSEWGKMEFRTAHIQAIHDGARVILVLYGDIDIESDLDDELKSFVRTNTYIKWGDPWFWKRLRYALPHSHVNGKAISQKTQNVTIALNERLDKTEDKLDLINIISPSPDPGTTPPVDHLNSPLKFIYSDVNCIG